MLLIWINYITTTNQDPNKSGSFKRPSFFIHPYRNYKTTIMKAPMAHKTYSQEQFMLRYYNLSISFDLSKPGLKPLKTLQDSIYFSLKTRDVLPSVSTNMLFLHKYSFNYLATDKSFFSFFEFHKHNNSN